MLYHTIFFVLDFFLIGPVPQIIMGLDDIVGSTPLLSADRRNLSGVTVRVIACRCTFASLPRFLISHLLHPSNYGYWAEHGSEK
jgi:hypothetical protein